MTDEATTYPPIRYGRMDDGDWTWMFEGGDGDPDCGPLWGVNVVLTLEHGQQYEGLVYGATRPSEAFPMGTLSIGDDEPDGVWRNVKTFDVRRIKEVRIT